MKSRIVQAVFTTLLFFTLSQQSWAGITARIGYLVPNFQVLPIGDIIDRNVIDENTEIGLEDMNEFFFVEIRATDDLRNTPVVVEIVEQLGAETLVRFVSSAERPFTLGQWMDGTNNGYLENDEFYLLQDSDWFFTDYNQTYYAETSDVLGLIEDGNMIRSSLVISLFVRTLDGTPLAAYSQTVEVYNPSPPQLMTPTNAESIPDLPILFSWEWNGGATTTGNWMFYLVEGDPNADGATVIENRNSLNTIYEGAPTSTLSNFYSHMSNRERPLEVGHTYYWMVEVEVPSALPGNELTYASDISWFQFGEDGGRPLIGLVTPIDGASVFNLPIIFEWNYAGFQSQRQDWEIRIARCAENDDPKSALENPRNRLYSGQPQSSSSHMLNRSNFNPDGPTRICWSVRVEGDFDGGYLESEPAYFEYAGERGRGGGVTHGGGGDGGGGPRHRGGDDEGSGTGMDDDEGSGGQQTGSQTGPDTGRRERPVQEHAPRQIVNDPVFDILSTVLTYEQISTLMIDLRGYNHKDIVIEGIGGQTISQLVSFLQQNNINIKQVRIVAE